MSDNCPVNCPLCARDDAEEMEERRMVEEEYDDQGDE